MNPEHLYSKNEEEFICFDDAESIIFKTKYATKSNLGGVSLFSLDFDDFSGKFCMDGKFPLLNYAKDTLLEINEDYDDSVFTEKEENSSNIESTVVKFYY